MSGQNSKDPNNGSQSLPDSHTVHSTRVIRETYHDTRPALNTYPYSPMTSPSVGPNAGNSWATSQQVHGSGQSTSRPPLSEQPADDQNDSYYNASDDIAIYPYPTAAAPGLRTELQSRVTREPLGTNQEPIDDSFNREDVPERDPKDNTIQGLYLSSSGLAPGDPQKQKLSSGLIDEETKTLVGLYVVTETSDDQKIRAFNLAHHANRQMNELKAKFRYYRESRKWPYKTAALKMIFPRRWSYLEIKVLRKILRQIDKEALDFTAIAEYMTTARREFLPLTGEILKADDIALAHCFLNWRPRNMPPRDYDKALAKYFAAEAKQALVRPLSELLVELEPWVEKREHQGQGPVDRLSLEQAIDRYILDGISQPNVVFLDRIFGFSREQLTAYGVHWHDGPTSGLAPSEPGADGPSPGNLITGRKPGTWKLERTFTRRWQPYSE